MKITSMIAGIAALAALLAAPPRGQAEDAAASPAPAAAEDRSRDGGTIMPGEKLTIDRCVAIALRNSPTILAASHTMNASRNRLGQAWSAYYPQIALSGGYTKRDSLFSWPNTLTPLPEESYNWSATLTQNIADFGRTDAQVSIRRRDLEALREDYKDARGQIVFNVKGAYYGLLRAEMSRDVLGEAVALFEKQLDEARGFYEAGIRSRFDVTNAEVELSNAKLKLVRAQNALRLARVTLNNAMGVPDASEYSIEGTLALKRYPITLEEARDRAFMNRPDIRSMEARREAAGASLTLARRGHFPTLSGSASFTRSGEAYPPEQDSWNVGLTLTIPLFSGFLTTHQVAEAKENLSAVIANETALRHNILLAVQQAHLKLQEVEELVAVAELMVKQAEENYELAHSRYEAGVGSPIEETNALVSLSNARMNHVSALADYKVAEAELQRAMGE